MKMEWEKSTHIFVNEVHMEVSGEISIETHRRVNCYGQLY